MAVRQKVTYPLFKRGDQVVTLNGHNVRAKGGRIDVPPNTVGSVRSITKRKYGQNRHQYHVRFCNVVLRSWPGACNSSEKTTVIPKWVVSVSDSALMGVEEFTKRSLVS